MTSLSLGALVTFLTALFLTEILRRTAPYLGLMDQPDPRKVHLRPTPRAGGLAILAALLAAWYWHPVMVGWLSCPALLLAAVLLSILGLVDDRFPLPWWFRLGVQSLLAGYLVWDMPSEFPGARFLAGFWLVAMVNAFNMLDNMDALSAGTAWISSLAFLGIFVWQSEPLGSDPVRLPALLLGAVAGFLVLNWPPARIFMGDAGSTLLGLLIGFLGLALVVAAKGSMVSCLSVLLICSVPVYDQTTVVLLRLSQGRSPFHPDRQHLSHRITDRGWSKSAAVFWIHGLGLAGGAVGVLLYTQPSAGTLTAAILVVLGWLLLAGYEFGPRQRSN